MKRRIFNAIAVVSAVLWVAWSILAIAVAAGFKPRMVPLRRGDLPGAESVQLDQSLTCEDPWSVDELIAFGAQALREELA